MAENKVSDTVNDMVNSMVEDINSAQNGSNKVSAIKDNVGYDMSRVHSANLKILKEKHFLTLLHVLSIRKAVCIRIAIRWTTMMEN